MYPYPRPRLACAALPLILVACGSSQKPYVYAPEQSSISVDGLPGAKDAIPPEAPTGDVRVASYGVTEVTPSADASPIPALHIRMIVSNNGGAGPWLVDPRALEVSIAGEGRSEPLYVSSDASVGMPEIHVPVREQRTLDLYFPLPATVSSADELPRFDFLWSVHTTRRVVSDRTVFERREIRDEPAYADVIVTPGWGPAWWYNPVYPRLVWVHPRRVVVHDHSQPPTVRLRQPHHVYAARPLPRGRNR